METRLYRSVDAVRNRLAEGLRVLEDVCRFSLNQPVMSEELKVLRHSCRRFFLSMEQELLRARNTGSDAGWAVSQRLNLEQRGNLFQLAAANFRRSQEACRTLFELCVLIKQEKSEESLSVLQDPRCFESMRKQLYQMEQALLLKLSCSLRQNPLPDSLYFLTHAPDSRNRGNVETARLLLEGGARILQYREKDLEGQTLLRETREIRRMTRDYGCLFYINDYVDLAMMAEADGVHLGQDDYDVSAVRKLIGEDVVIGLSTHSPEQAQQALSLPVDYIGVGPVFATQTKKNVCDPVGLDYLDYVKAHVSLPHVAIGGIKAANYSQVLDHGADCCALVTEVTSSDDPAVMIQRLRHIRENQ